MGNILTSAEMSPQQRMFVELDDIARAPEASMTFTVIDPATINIHQPEEVEMHSCITWYAPLVSPTDEEVILYTLSAPGESRVHSSYIEAWEAKGKAAPASGGMRKDGQAKNNPGCHGVTFKGEARTVLKDGEIESALAVYAIYNTFDSDNLRKYLAHSSDQIPTHRVYKISLSKAVVMDGRLGDDNPDRIARLDWAAGRGWARQIING
jgi:hypothetical protein